MRLIERATAGLIQDPLVQAKRDGSFSILVARNWWAAARTEFLQNFYLPLISSTE